MYDLLIKNGTIYDGSGQASYQADIGIEENKNKTIVSINKKSKL